MRVHTGLHLATIILGVLVLACASAVVGIVGYRILSPKVAAPLVDVQHGDESIISGSIQYNGVRPVSSESGDGRVVLYRRALTDVVPTKIPIDVPLIPDATWSWSEAQSGQTYELQASVEFAGRELARSNTIVVTAPASGEQLTFNVSDDQIPEDLKVLERVLLSGDVTNEAMPTPTLIVLPNPATLVAVKQPVSITGRINLSGYIPPTARLVLKAGLDLDTMLQIVSSEIETKDNAVWVWSGAEPGKRYRVSLQLMDKDVIFGKSDEVIVAAPATNQYLQLVSTATPPPQPPNQRESITGKIDLNGPVANNSSILILQRSPGEKSYSVVVRIPAGDGQTWSFDKASSSAQYEMTAALQVNNENTSSANAVTLTAPASNVVFRINTNVSLNAPGRPRLLTCGSRKSDGKWQAQVVFEQVQNANSYWLEIGASAGKNDVYNERRIRSKSNEESVTLDFDNGKTYYVRYAQAQCLDCRSDQDYSGFSESTQMSCSN